MRFLAKYLNTRVYVALGLISLAVSIVLMSSVLGIFPDKERAVREGRAAVAETLLATVSALPDERDAPRVQGVLNFEVKRGHIVSAAVRRADGVVVAKAGPHDESWAQARSPETHVEVPISDGGNRWGQLELRFPPLAPGGIVGVVTHPLLLFAAYMAVSGFFAFYFYLGKMLSQLDPSRA